MVEDIVKAWRDPYFREVEARADAVRPHPAGEIGQLELESVVGGSEEDATILTLWCCTYFTCPTSTGPECEYTVGGFCVTMNSWDQMCCCQSTSDPFYCF